MIIKKNMCKVANVKLFRNVLLEWVGSNVKTQVLIH